LSDALEKQLVLPVSKKRVSLLYVAKVTKVTLIGAHEMVPIPSHFEPLLIAAKSLIVPLIILWSPNWKRAARWHIVTISASHPLAGTPVSSFAREVVTEHALRGTRWFCATGASSSQRLPVAGSLVVSKAYNGITTDRQRLVRAHAEPFHRCYCLPLFPS
jgi:hypothetical protein